MIAGPAKAIPAAMAAEPFRNCRRVSTFAFLVLLLVNSFCLPFPIEDPELWSFVVNLCGIIISNALITRNANLFASESHLLYP
jgi:hypothetical protein